MPWWGILLCVSIPVSAIAAGAVFLVRRKRRASDENYARRSRKSRRGRWIF